MHLFNRCLIATSLVLSLLQLQAFAAPEGPIPLPTQEGKPLAWSSFKDCVEALTHLDPAHLPDEVVHTCPLHYSARKPSFDADGRPVLDATGHATTTQVGLTGRVFFPPSWRKPEGSALSLVIYSHGTELKRDAVPSTFKCEEWVMGAAAAAWFGFAVAMPDGPGMGGDTSGFHPYCHAQSLAYATVDSLPAIQNLLTEDPYLASHHYAWDGKLYLTGYSEGGYTTLAAVKELEAKDSKGGSGAFKLAASACMAGPFDLSGTMRTTFIDPVQHYPRSYYLPYFILGYHQVYGRAVEPEAVFSQPLLETRSDGNVLAWAKGDLAGEDVDARIGRRLGTSPDAINLRVMFNPLWLSQELLDPAYATSRMHGLLAENDLYQGWTPTRPILFRHSPDDANVPYANTLLTLDHLGQEIRKAGGQPEALLVSMPIGKPGDAIPHAKGALIAIPSSFAWFAFGMPAPEAFATLPW